jgi:hypothetical protein
MALSSWLRSLRSRFAPSLARQRRPHRRSRPGCRPQLEVLEDRTVPSTLSYDSRNILTFTGGATSNVTISGSGGNFTFHDDAGPIAVDDVTFYYFNVTTANGSNTGTVYLTALDS